MPGARPLSSRKTCLALYYDLPIYREVYRLILPVFEYVRDFSRDYTFSLGPHM